MQRRSPHFLTLCLTGCLSLGAGLKFEALAIGVPAAPHSPGPGSSQVTTSPGSLTFGNQQIWSISPVQSFTVTNDGSVPITFVSIVASGDFSQANGCERPLQPRSSCTVKVKFTPSATGTRTGYITLNDTDSTILQTVNLTGTGTAVSGPVAVTPGVVSLTFSQSQQFQATLNGLPTSDVTWAVNSIVGGNSKVGTISSTGLYQPAGPAGQRKITAATTSQPHQFNVAVVEITNNRGVFNFRNDIAQTGQNLNETVLTTGNVNSQQFGKLFSYPVDGYVWPDLLYVQNVSIPGQGTHNVLYVADEHDSVYAFDADGKQSTPLWQTSFIDPPNITTIPSSDTGAMNISPEVGITGTPVIDHALGRIYLVADTKQNGSYYQTLHALDITTGDEVSGSPVVISASVSGIGSGSSGGEVSFNALRESQRPALILVNGVVYVGFASRADIDPFHGWLLGYDAQTLQQVQVFNDSPNGARGGIWQGGAAPAADADGNIFLVTGNGTFNASSGGTEYGDSFIKLSTEEGGDIDVVDYFTPHDQAILAANDEDLGSSGNIVIPDQEGPYPHMLIGAGKEGVIYLVNRDDMGGYNPDNDDQIIQSITGAIYATFTAPAFWQKNIYFSAVGDWVKQFQLYGGLLSTTALVQSKAAFQYPGMVPTISANGGTNGIVWVIDGHSSLSSGPAVLHAFDAANVSRELYNTTQDGSRDQCGPAVRFTVPTIANGKVYVPAQYEVDAYGLLP